LIEPGEVLDLACGAGRHARLLAARGLRVLAVDRDPVALKTLRTTVGGEGVTTVQVDLETEGASHAPNWPFTPERFAGIVVTNYLHRPLFEPLLRSLAPGGMLIYETFAAGNQRFGKPSNPDFLLRRGELFALPQHAPALRFHVLAYEDGQTELPRPAVVQRICLVRLAVDDVLPSATLSRR
jgi:SAM-dependent methyltransferase